MNSLWLSFLRSARGEERYINQGDYSWANYRDLPESNQEVTALHIFSGKSDLDGIQSCFFGK